MYNTIKQNSNIKVEEKEIEDSDFNKICDKLTRIEKMNNNRYIVEYEGNTFVIDRTDQFSIIGEMLFKYIDENKHLVKEYIKDEFAKFPIELKSFRNGLISIQDFLLHIQEISLNTFKAEWQKTDELISMREKRKILGIWQDFDETGFMVKLKEYKELVEEYKSIKSKAVDIQNKDDLISFYCDVLTPRLDEIRGIQSI